MPRPSSFLSRPADRLWLFGSVLVFVFCLYYSYLHIRLRHIMPFNIDPGSWVVTELTEPCSDSERCIQPGDRLLSISGLERKEFLSSRRVDLIREPAKIEALELRFLRSQEERTLTIPVSPLFWRAVLPALTDIIFPLIFWLTGTVAVVFIQPRETRRLVFIFFFYNTAIWFSTGVISFFQIGVSAIVFHVAIWLFLPLSVHLHAIIPDSPLAKTNRLVIPLYLVAAILIVLDAVYLLPPSAYLWSTLVAFVASLVIIIARIFLQQEPSNRVVNRLMLFGISVGLGPVAMTYILPLLAIEPTDDFGSALMQGIALTALPIWPITYVIALYKHRIGTFELRANRLIGIYGFLTVFILTYVAVFFLVGHNWLALDDERIFLILLLSLAFVAIAAPLRHHFQRSVDRIIFDIPYTSDEIISLFAERIPEALDRTVLRAIIVRQILPSLMIRQSALYLFSGTAVETLYEQNVDISDKARSGQQLEALLDANSHAFRPIAERGSAFEWVHVLVPVSIQEQILGIWLLGRRDPDDLYPRTDIELLTNLANQIAPVVKAQQKIEENQNLHHQLVHSQKMEALGRLSACVAHDFNNLLSIILGCSDLILNKYQGDIALRDYHASIKDAADKAVELTKQLLTLGRQQVMEERVVNLNSIILSTENLLKRLAAKSKVELETNLEANLGSVVIDVHQMEQALLNLVVNACDAMPQGGQLRIATFNVAESEDLAPFSLQTLINGYTVLEISDTGIGVPPDVQPHIFEPFFTTKEIGKGTGLGLSMVYGIVKQSRGQIFVESQPGTGTTFRIYLPTTTEDVSETTIHRPQAAIESGSETILVVEDEDGLLNVICEVLRANGYTVLPAKDGNEAIAVSERYSDPINLLLTDVIMPQVTGPELAAKLIQSRPRLRVLYMSGYNDELVHGHRIGEDETAFIEKPFTPATLAEKIRMVLEGPLRGTEKKEVEVGSLQLQ